MHEQRQRRRRPVGALNHCRQPPLHNPLRPPPPSPNYTYHRPHSCKQRRFARAAPCGRISSPAPVPTRVRRHASGPAAAPNGRQSHASLSCCGTPAVRQTQPDHGTRGCSAAGRGTGPAGHGTGRRLKLRKWGLSAAARQSARMPPCGCGGVGNRCALFSWEHRACGADCGLCAMATLRGWVISGDGIVRDGVGTTSTRASSSQYPCHAAQAAAPLRPRPLSARSPSAPSSRAATAPRQRRALARHAAAGTQRDTRQSPRGMLTALHVTPKPCYKRHAPVSIDSPRPKGGAGRTPSSTSTTSRSIQHHQPDLLDPLLDRARTLDTRRSPPGPPPLRRAHRVYTPCLME
jgi:hypothetical protein